MTLKITVLGMVQGIGFRPFVARLAGSLSVTGSVRNSGGIVKIIATASQEAMDEFIHRLVSQPPAFADISSIDTKPLPDQAFDGFSIIKSESGMEGSPLVPSDLPMCEDCLKELRDPQNRRYRYPFISCTSCGPRYSIITSLPYDRETTTMEAFPMCPSCAQEYSGDDRRRHAQTISCHNCGPQLIFRDAGGVCEKETALERAIGLLKNGAVLAIKGIGGYQFACSPFLSGSVHALRLLKHREKKPFAIMFPDVQAVRAACYVNAAEESLLRSPARPIVLLGQKKNGFSADVCSESRKLGAFLPYTPLHQLLTDACGPLIMTSGNISSQPIMTQDSDMLSLSSPYLGGVLYNTRGIRTPLDDSVARVFRGKTQLLRRSRGYAPLPVILPYALSSPVLAMGGDLKSCFCLADQKKAYLSQYLGDVEQYDVFRSYQDTLSHMESLFRIRPQAVVCDMHPRYHTTQLAREFSQKRGIPLFCVQHHHAHILSVMAEHSLSGCIGVAFDGTGYGTDGTVWGGEFLLCRQDRMTRMGCLEPVSLLGGDQLSRDAGLGALCHLHACGLASGDERFPMVRAAIMEQINIIRNSSMGRLFDAVSALLDLKCYNSYEGECAIALENCAADAQRAGISPYPLPFDIVEMGGMLCARRAPLIRELEHRRVKTDAGALALGFHISVSEMVLAMCRSIRLRTQENRVALSGGVFANELLLERCVSLLEQDHFDVYLNSAVPCNDGGIAFGQAYFAALSAQ